MVQLVYSDHVVSVSQGKYRLISVFLNQTTGGAAIGSHLFCQRKTQNEQERFELAQLSLLSLHSVRSPVPFHVVTPNLFLFLSTRRSPPRDTASDGNTPPGPERPL